MKEFKYIYTKAIIVTIIIVTSFSSLVIGQDKGRGITAEISLGTTRSENWIGSSDYGTWVYGITLSPRIGYRISNAGSVGFLFTYNSPAPARTYGFGVYASRDISQLKKNISLFAEAHYLYYHKANISDLKGSYSECGIVPGLTFHVPSIPIDIKFRYLFIGFNNGDVRQKTTGGCLGRGNWILDAGLRRLEIGAVVTF